MLTADRRYGTLLVFLLCVALLRTVVDMFWISYYRGAAIFLLTALNTTVYVYLLHLTPISLGCWFLKKLWRIEVPQSALPALYYESAFIWVAYPLVSVISMATHSPPQQTIPFFRYVPGFMVERNFLPIGMLAVIPPVVGGYAYFFAKHLRIAISRALVASVLSFAIVYLLFYQYLLRLSYGVLDHTNLLVFAGFYTLLFVLFTWPALDPFARAFGKTALPCGPNGQVLKAGLLGAGAISLALVATGLHALDGQAVASRSKAELSWQLWLMAIASEQGELAGGGYFLQRGDGPATWLLRVDGEELTDASALTWSKDGFSIHETTARYESSAKPSFTWNRNPIGSDAFLETFRGTEHVHRGSLTHRGKRFTFAAMEEHLHADPAKVHLWKSETFLFLAAEGLSIIAFNYDGYIDGSLHAGGVEKRVIGLQREGDEVRIELEGGRARATVQRGSAFDIYHVPQGPIDHPVTAALTLELDGRAPVAQSALGVIEVIR